MSARITIKPPLRKPPTISVPSRARGSARTPSEGASEPADEDKNGAAMDVDVTRVEDEADDGDGASSSARTLDATPGPEDATPGPGDAPPDPDAPPVKRPRGRPRGTGNPRGRPRGSRGVGRGRGRGRGGAAVRGGDDDERSGTPAEGEEYATSRVETTRAVAGRTYIIDGDELVTDDDPAGDEKIDINGNLLGGRVFKAQTFTLPNRHPTKMYMLAIDAARTSGFRDSLYYFRRNPLAFKLNATPAEKEDLISRGKLGGHLRTRAVTLITARSAYKLHGAKTVVGGRWVVDDYYVERAAAECVAKGLSPGDPVGELVDPRAPKALVEDAPDRAERERAGEWGMYKPGGPTTLFGASGFGPFSEGPLSAPKKAFYVREGVTEENWMFEAARRAREADADWARGRRSGLKPCGGVYGENTPADKYPEGVYEPHAAIVVYRSDTQPTRSRWERLSDSEDKRAMLGGSKTGRHAWALAWVDTAMELPTEEEKPASLRSSNALA